MKNLNRWKKLQICKAYMINAMEDFLSSVINTNFADCMSAEFVVILDPFCLSQHGINETTTNSSLFMYPLNQEKYDIPKEFVGFDGAVSMEIITRHVFVNLPGRKKKSSKLALSGFDIKNTVYVFDVLKKDGHEKLNKKINEIKNSLCFHNTVECGSNYIESNLNYSNKLMQCMLKIIEKIDQNTYYSPEFEKIKSWMINEEELISQ